MRIDEITIPRKLRRGVQATHNVTKSENGFTVEPMRELLKKTGWEFVNSGYFSGVYVNADKPYVMKINIRPDIGYDKFVKLTKKLNSPYLPKIHDRKYFTKDGKTYYIYLIEKLEECDPALANDINTVAREIEYIPQEIFDAEELKFVKEDNRNIDEDYPRLIDLIVTLTYRGHELMGLGGIVEIAQDNIMQREDGTPVIIDPYATLNLYGMP
jgi:hypothetical protein